MIAATGTGKIFPISALMIEITTYRADLAGIIRLYFGKVKAAPVKFLHQSVLQLSSCEGGKLTVLGAAFLKLLNIQSFQHRSRILINRPNIRLDGV